MKALRWATFAVVALWSAQGVAAGDSEAGRDKAETCFGCHGIPGYNNVYPTYRVPKLGGQSAEYIVTALKAYRSGERQHPTMGAQASSMSDEDIQDIAAFLSTAPADGAVGKWTGAP